MIDSVVALDPRIVDLPLEAELLLIAGEPASGKSEALARRYVALVEREGIPLERTLVAATSAASAEALAGRIAARLDTAPRARFAGVPFAGVTLDVLAFAIVRDGALAGGLPPDIERLESYEAEAIFERAAAPLFSADWAEFLGPDVDPEISGLRAPDRFAAAVLRLIGKLRDAGIGPDELLSRSQRGAATFYAKPPNFAEPGLLYATRDEYRSSLTVGPGELERQRRREIDLAKIVTKLYRSYAAELVEYGCLSSGDAIGEAIRLLDEQPALAQAYRERLICAVVDDAQDLRPGEVRLLQAIFGKPLARVSFAGSLESAIATFAGARPEGTFKLAATTIALAASRPKAPVTARRFADRDAEAAFVADGVAALVSGGTPAERIAVVHCSARTLATYADALVDRDVAVALHGDVDLLAQPDVQDALGVLWSATDPFRHAWLMRTLQLPQLALSDASLAVLCGEPADPQAMLFPLPPDDPDTDRRWDRRRDIRLATNVLRGERDADLGPTARERLIAFRARRGRWASHAREAGARGAAAIVADAGLLAARDGETAARAARRAALIAELLLLIERYAVRHRGATLDDALVVLERVAAAERGPVAGERATAGAFVGAIGQLGPRRFEHVFIVDVRAGSFPPYYVPDAFLFSPHWGMIPKDAAGDGTAARTAKFTWYSHHARLRDTYAAEHRRMLTVAMSRADVAVTVSASGRATRGVGMPEFASELGA